MGTLKVRQGVIGGFVLSTLIAATAAGRAAEPLPTFIYYLVVCLAAGVIAIVLVVAINRPRPPMRW